MGKISRRRFVQGTGAGLLAANVIPPLKVQQVEERGNEVVIAEAITLSGLAENPLIHGHYAALAETARAAGNAGTLAEHFPEIAPALVALDAKFKIAEPSGDVRLPGYKGWTFYTPYSTSTAHTLRSAYDKGMAVALEMEGSVCKKARIVLGGAAPILWRATKAETLLEGKGITPELAAQAGQAAAEGIRPLEKNKYKVKLTKTMVKRAVAALGSA